MLPLNCAKETLAEKATTTSKKKQRTAVVNLIQIPPTSILTNLARPENAFRTCRESKPATGSTATTERSAEKANASSPTIFRENVYFLLGAIYIRFSNGVKQKFGCNSIFTLLECREPQHGGLFPCRTGLTAGVRMQASRGARHHHTTGFDQP